MATPPDPQIYLADDWSWAITATSTPATAFQNFYVWDTHGGLSVGYGYVGAYGFAGESSSGTIGWSIINLDTGAGITNARMGVCYGNNQKGVIQNNLELFRMRETASGPTHVYFTTDGSNRIQARRGDGTVIGTTDGTTGGVGMVEYFLPASASDGSGPTYHIEAIVTVHDTTGTVQMWVNDIQVLDLTGKDTRVGGSGVIGYIEWHATAGRRICEVFVHDGSARLSSQWRAGYIPVATDGTYSDGTAVGAATFLQAVDDTPTAPENEITTYGVLDATGTPKKTSFQSGALPASWLQIRDVHPQMVVEKSDGGTNTGKIGLRSASTDEYGTVFGVPTGWIAKRLALRTDIVATNPLWTLITAAASEVIVDRET